MSDNKCKSCNGTGIAHEFLWNISKECSSCDATGFDKNYKDEIVCPYCGHSNSTDEFYESNNSECSGCEKKFYVEVNHSVDYSTARVDCLNDESLHKWKHEVWYNEGAPREGKYYYHCADCSERKWLAKEPK